MGKVVLHLQKASGSDSGMSAHIERTIIPKNVIPTRTYLNKELIEFPPGVNNRTEAIKHRLEIAGIKRKIGKNQVKAIRILASGSPEDMQRIEQVGQLDEWCQDTLKWLQQVYGAENIVSAVLHMDETTPHIHATMIPIVTGERLKKKKENVSTKKKYRTKAANTVRLCADDVMRRHKLKEYQTSYAGAMTKYGLERGIDGSKAKHISTSQYYKDLVGQSASIQDNISNLVGKKKDALEELSQLKSNISKEKFKNSAADMGSKLIDGLNSILGTPKLVKIEEENIQLKEQVNILTKSNVQFQKRIDTVKTEALMQIKDYANKFQQRETKLKGEILEYRKLQDKIFVLFPLVKKALDIETVCSKIGFNIVQIRELLNKGSIIFKGKLYSDEYKCNFETPNALVKMESDPKEPNKYSLSIDGVDILKWFRQKFLEFGASIRKNNPSKERNKGLKV
ncbi:MAG: MobV family relaxase [Phocaeicola sp.]